MLEFKKKKKKRKKERKKEEEEEERFCFPISTHVKKACSCNYVKPLSPRNL
jgi:hypothetical protein